MIIILLRTLIVFLSIIISMRIMGKRQLGELEPSELVVAVLISDLASHPIQDIGIPLINGLIPVVTLLCCELIFSGAIMNSTKVRALLCGKPSMLVHDGRINQKEMRKNRFTLDELTEEMRNQSITDISKVKYAILETDGRLNTILYPGEQPVTAAQMNIDTSDDGYTSIIINDGRIMSENLRLAGRDESWLEKEIKKHGAERAKDVYILTLNNAGMVYYAGKEA